jgi:hypothetical protein
VLLFLYVVFGIWLVATAINQFEWKFWSNVRALDCFGLLPKWTFFAPRPGTNDVRIVYRDHLKDGTRGSWVELPSTPYRNALVRMFWNPEKLENKAVFDLVQALGMEYSACKTHPAATLVSIAYIQLLDPIMKRVRNDETIARQFALITTRGHVPPRKPEILMVSLAHPFDPV